VDHKTTPLLGTKEICERSQCQYDARPMRSSDHTTAEVKTTEVEERPLDQSDELEEITQSRNKGGALRPLGGRIDYEVHAGEGVHRNSEESDESINTDICAAAQTRAIKQRELKPPKPLKVSSMNGLDIGLEQLIDQQRSDETLRRYWQLEDKPSLEGKPQFVTKNGIRYRKQKTKSGVGYKMQLVVPIELREWVVALAHDTLLSGHRGAAKTLHRVQQEFYWPEIHNFVTQYVASGDLCLINVSKGTVWKASMEKLPLVATPFSTICVDIIGPLSPPSDGYKYISTLVDIYQCQDIFISITRFPEAVALKDITTSMVVEALLEILSRVGLPLKLHSDHGSQFTTDMMKEVYRLLSVKQSTTSPYHAMSNGFVENLTSV